MSTKKSLPIWQTAPLISPILLLERLRTGEAEVANPRQFHTHRLQGYIFHSSSQAERTTQNINKKRILPKTCQNPESVISCRIPGLSSLGIHRVLRTYSHLNPSAMLTSLRTPSSLSSSATHPLCTCGSSSLTLSKVRPCALWNFLWKQNPRVQ